MSSENQEEKARKSLDDRQKMTELERIRHSCAHVLATGILRIWPDAQFAAGPPVENGFYYDVELDHRISPEDFPKIEEEMKREIKANHAFEKIQVTREQALNDARSGRLGALGERPGKESKFKIGNIADIPEAEQITYYKNGDFIDLCAGPHVMRTGNIGAFKLTSVASAYYKGDERNPQLQRIYGTAFKNKTEMDDYFKMLEEAKRRDHRKIGKEMELFTLDEDVGPGMVLWLPNGTVLCEELEKLAKETEFAAGYVRVRTPILAKESMYLKSGHLPYYADKMFPPMEVKEDLDDKESVRYYIKAMNCPHHHKIFSAVQHSYRDLPLRLAEYGWCHRYEQSGELMGSMRVRAMQMNDAHIYCTPEQFADEFRAVNEMYLKYFKLFGFAKYLMRFSTHDPAHLGQKYVNDPILWKKTEDMVREVMVESKINFVEVSNEAAFYGPKIDVEVWSVSGRQFTIATNQVDFAVPARFNLVYRTRDNSYATPICIHRAPLGTHERFIGFLIEHYAGNFPLWLSPKQVRIIPIATEQVSYAEGIVAELREQGIRAEMEFSADKLNGRIQRAEEDRVHIMLIIGQREQAANSVAVRVHQKGNLGVRIWNEVKASILRAVKERSSEFSV